MQIITYKHYMDVFGCCRRTAQQWLKDDLEMLNRPRLTEVQFDFIYKGVDRLNVPEVYNPTLRQKGVKMRNNAQQCVRKRKAA